MNYLFSRQRMRRSLHQSQRQARRNHSFICALTWVGLGLWLGVSMAANASDSELGAALYKTSCSACHGADASGSDALNSPSLAGQSADYIVRQLGNFSSGVRGGAGSDPSAIQMRAISQTITKEENRAALAQYLSELATQAVTSTAGNTELGYKLYQASCGTCHGSDARGNDLLFAPKLAGLSASYLTRQYQNFLSGQRGGEGADKVARQMKMMAATLRDPSQIDAVVAYLTSLKP